MRGRFFLKWIVALFVLIAPAAHAVDPGTCEALIEKSNAQIETMRRYAAEIGQSVQALSDALAQAEQRNAEQTQQIERLQQELHESRLRGSEAQNRQRREFFAALGERLPAASELYEVLPDHLVVAIDPVFISGQGELAEEGRDLLRPLADGLLSLLSRLNERVAWRLRIEGHSDSRPVRAANPYFESNWELSAARAVGMLDYLVDRGVSETRVSAVGLADTRQRVSGKTSAAHSRNRRIEIHLVFPPPVE